ncbi:murein transglycosylase, partial [Francisella tularensis]|nr:murein transglycosylase [Francisella tularensis]
MVFFYMDIKKVKETLKKIVIIVSLILITGCANITAQQYLSKKYSKNIDYKKSSFEDLANWD